MNLLDESFGDFILHPVDYEVNTAEMVRCFQNIIHIDAFFSYADCVRLEYIPRLFVGETASFDVV